MRFCTKPVPLPITTSTSQELCHAVGKITYHLGWIVHNGINHLPTGPSTVSPTKSFGLRTCCTHIPRSLNAPLQGHGHIFLGFRAIGPFNTSFRLPAWSPYGPPSWFPLLRGYGDPTGTPFCWERNTFLRPTPTLPPSHLHPRPPRRAGLLWAGAAPWPPPTLRRSAAPRISAMDSTDSLARCRVEARRPERPTVDGRNPAPPKKPWNDDSPVNTNNQWFPHGFKVAPDFVYP